MVKPDPSPNPQIFANGNWTNIDKKKYEASARAAYQEWLVNEAPQDNQMLQPLAPNALLALGAPLEKALLETVRIADWQFRTIGKSYPNNILVVDFVKQEANRLVLEAFNLPGGLRLGLTAPDTEKLAKTITGVITAPLTKGVHQGMVSGGSPGKTP